MLEPYEQNTTYDSDFEVCKTIFNILKDKDKEYYELFEDYVAKLTILYAVTGACFALVLYFLFHNSIVSVLVMSAGCFIAGINHFGGMTMVQNETEELQKRYDEVLGNMRAVFEEAKEGEDK